jgi:TonB-linked SusC/RagA family outer membrane protein
MKLLYCSAGKLCLYTAYLIFFYFLLCAWRPALGQTPYRIQGGVLSAENQQPLVGASVIIKGSNNGVTTNKNGNFILVTTENKVTLVLSFIGYRSLDTLLQLPLKNNLILILQQDETVMNEVSVTGYQTIPKERATGSFVQIENEMINRKVSANILDRLDGISSGLLFTGQSSNAISANPLGRNLGIRIRGESTLADASQVSRDPLIVLDNFPFEGNPDNINPNDIESVTILKDAAAASIWGARAGNGVIVIVTKKGRSNQPMKVALNSNITAISKPDPGRDKSFLSSKDYIGAEQYLFFQGYFDNDILNSYERPVVSPAVRILSQQRSGVITVAQGDTQLSFLKNLDVREDFNKYVYQKAVNQQYSVGLTGGTRAVSYHFSAGYDHNISSVKRNGYNRFTISSQNTYEPFKGLSLSAGVSFSSNTLTENNYQNQYGSIRPGGKYADLYPYARLVDPNGQPLAVTRDYSQAFVEQAQSEGFQDWQYRPLEEIALGNKSTKTSNLILKSALNFKFNTHFNAGLSYQHEQQQIGLQNEHSSKSYYVRDLVNKFSVRDSAGIFKYPVPKGGILELDQVTYRAHNARFQVNFDQTFAKRHGLTAIAGTEIRGLKTEQYSRVSYGYDHSSGISVNNLDFSRYLPTNPAGLSMIPATDGSISGFVNRFISYYANGSYVFDRKYTVSLSARRDGSNIFGAKTNDRVTPLWSAGAAWDISTEEFYHLGWIPHLRFRASYGTSGNVYQGSVYVTGTYLNSDQTGALLINNLMAPNPNLRWETIKTANMGIDFGFFGERLTGSLELYRKLGRDLIQNQLIAPSSGFNFFYGNSAGTSTKGFDLILTGKNLQGPFRWDTNLLLSRLSDKITRYDALQGPASIQGSSGRTGLVGKPLYALYSYKWAGIDPSNGDPVGLLNGEVSKDYQGIIANYNPDSLVYHGSSVPTWFGSLRNDLSYQHWSLSVNITYKLGYYFRRPSTSINYSDVLSGYAHSDYAMRWQDPADQTQVPSMVYPSNAQRNTFYQYAQTLVERADHIRFQDIRLGYSLSRETFKSMPFDNAQFYLYASNLGLVWKANKKGLDPDYVSLANRHLLPAPFSISLGLRAEF